MLEPVNITSVVHKSVIIGMENQFRWPRVMLSARARVAGRRLEMEKKHSKDKKVVPEEHFGDRKECPQANPSIITIPFPLSLCITIICCFRCEFCLVDGDHAVIYNISPRLPSAENSRTTQKPIKLLFLSSRWNLIAILWKFVDDGSSPKSEVDTNYRWTDTGWLWLRERTNV